MTILSSFSTPFQGYVMITGQMMGLSSTGTIINRTAAMKYIPRIPTLGYSIAMSTAYQSIYRGCSESCSSVVAGFQVVIVTLLELRVSFAWQHQICDWMIHTIKLIPPTETLKTLQRMMQSIHSFHLLI